jgi:preprotein translocase subunit SecY
MLDRLANVFRIQDLRRRIIITVLLVAVCRVGVYVPVPGVDSTALERLFKTKTSEGGVAGALGVVNLFAGGALEKCAIFGLGVMPYISSSIIFQLLASVVPALEKLKKEGEAGRKKINQYTRYATVPLCFIQALVIVGGVRTRWHDVFPRDFGLADTMMAAFLMTCGTMFLMWIGEQIDEYGIGNGISLIIMVGILDRLPAAATLMASGLRDELHSDMAVAVIKLLIMLGLFAGMVVGVIFVIGGQRRIPFQQAKLTRGRRMYGGMKQYLPLGVNAAGVMPIIFAQSLIMIPGMFIIPLAQANLSPFWSGLFKMLSDNLRTGSFVYSVLFIILIFFFCYFWTAIQFNPTEMADNLKEHGSFIPGIRPGRRTAEHLERVMNRITLPGAAFLAAIAIIPSLVASAMKVDYIIAGFYGGTTLLIVVGVALDLVRKVEAELLMRHYEGFTRVGRRWR